MTSKKIRKKTNGIHWLLIFGIAISSFMMKVQAHEGAVHTNNAHTTFQHPPVDGLIRDLQQRFPAYSPHQVILVDATAQRLMLIEHGDVVASWLISTAEKGLGSLKGSNQTPLGVHRVSKRYGDGAPLGAIFKARRNTGRIADILTAHGARSQADNVTTRILWLDGLEPGLNKGGNIDSFERYIYIHGTDEEGRLGTPASHGCIRMRNQDVIDLYQRTGIDTLVVIAQQKQG
ncbi:MAG: L,D-transpeptidase family protein [Thiolinea sp.]